MSDDAAAMRRSSSVSCRPSCSSTWRVIDGSVWVFMRSTSCAFAITSGICSVYRERSVRRSASAFVSSSTAAFRSGDATSRLGMLRSCSGVIRAVWPGPEQCLDRLAVAARRLALDFHVEEAGGRRILNDQPVGQHRQALGLLERDLDLELLQLPLEALQVGARLLELLVEGDALIGEVLLLQRRCLGDELSEDRVHFDRQRLRPFAAQRDLDEPALGREVDGQAAAEIGRCLTRRRDLEFHRIARGDAPVR